MAKITALKIHPAIGVARLGNHPNNFYIGPEVPNQFIGNSDIAKFKSIDGGTAKINRQGARFRVYAYFDDGTTKELTSDNADINWQVKIANTKASFDGFYAVGQTVPHTRRNDFVADNDKGMLNLMPNEIQISGVSQNKTFAPVTFTVTENGVPLSTPPFSIGECKTDEQGRLIVLGGFGSSSSVKPSAGMPTFDNNSYWCDDVSDGYVKASVKIKDTGEVFSSSQVADAWVICAPPKYVPGAQPLITLYDTLFNKFVDDGRLPDIGRPGFYKHIYPIFQRAYNVKYLFSFKLIRAHHEIIKSAMDPGAGDDLRNIIYNQLRQADGSGGNMPQLFGDFYENGGMLTLTKVQLRILQKWNSHEFDIDDQSVLQPPSQITPAGLDQAALENCIGGAFYPGIEASWYLRDKFEFIEPFRLKSSLLIPGDLTKQMALPWQADFADCAMENVTGWWPFARPDFVYPDGGQNMVPWFNGANGLDMVKNWKSLGLVLEKEGRFVQVADPIV